MTVPSARLRSRMGRSPGGGRWGSTAGRPVGGKVRWSHAPSGAVLLRLKSSLTRKATSSARCTVRVSCLPHPQLNAVRPSRCQSSSRPRRSSFSPQPQSRTICPEHSICSTSLYSPPTIESYWVGHRAPWDSPPPNEFQGHARAHPRA